MSKTLLISLIVALPLIAGCKIGSGAAGISDVEQLFASDPIGSSGAESESFSSASSGPPAAASIATIANPEPASVALFGAGLAGVILNRRRRTRRGGRSSAAR